DRQAVAAGGGDRALGGDDVGGLDLVQLHGAVVAAGDGCLAAGEGDRLGGAEVDRDAVLVADGRLGGRVGGGVGAGEGQALVAGVAGVGVAVGVLGADREVVRGAGGLRARAADHELRRRAG